MAADGTAKEAGAGGPERITPEQGAKLARAGVGLIEQKASELNLFTRPADELKGPEQTLKNAEILRQGVDPEHPDEPFQWRLYEDGKGDRLKAIPMQEGFSIPLSDGTTADNVCLAGIQNVDEDSGKYVVYFARINADGKAGDIIFDNGELVTGLMAKDAAAARQAAAGAEDLRTLYEDDDQKVFDAFTDSQTEGTKYVPPDGIDDLTDQVAAEHGISLDAPVDEKVTDEPSDLDRFIGSQIVTLQKEFDLLDDGERKRNIAELLRDLKLGALAKGEAGIFYRIDALTKLKKNLADKIKRNTVKGDVAGAEALGKQIDALDAHQQEMATKVEDVKYDLRYTIDDNNPPNKEELMEMIDNNDVLSVLEDRHVRGIEGISTLIFGNETISESTINELIDVPYLDQDTKERLGKLKTAGKITGISLLAILLGIPLATAMAITKAAQGAMKG